MKGYNIGTGFGQKKAEYKNLAVKVDGRRLIGRPKSTLGNNIKIPRYS
jgi:RNase P/RNase MRP subunit p29